ncbi:glycosyltransferase family 2 protein [Synechococcus sp. BDU 130192]|uniref:glycosyltransferase family 2 protein n=1 Tax=Synechococcus sp. BDU 130192 TaxID=2042059 RepID=UPI000C077BEE|nr:glycosyltransferase [Synechococcus sp. BDU 130192]
MKFSLITSTLGEDRHDKIVRLIHSLIKQKHQDFELIIVDQNENNDLKEKLKSYTEKLNLIYLKHNRRGLTAGRNLGLRYVSGDIIAFPDDDCWYSESLLESIKKWFVDNEQWDGLCGCTIDLDGNLTSTKWDSTAGEINKFNIWRRAISSSIFLKAPAINDIQGFDETLGPGANSPWQCSDETDYLLSLLSQNKKLHYDPEIKVYHLEPITQYNQQALVRAKRYAPGTGRVLKKHSYPFWFVAIALLRPILGTLYYATKMQGWRAKFHWLIFQGRLNGWLSSK